MKFKKYSSIENSYRDLEINKIKNNVNPNEEWVVTEKIHGANFSFLVNRENNIAIAKRSGIIKNENFYNSEKILNKYLENILILVNDFFIFDNVQQVQIYGEIFGGLYNNKTDKEAKKIQKEVQYIPFNDFIVYDIAVDYIEKDTYYNERLFLEWDKLKEFTSKYNLKHVPELFKGTLEECLNYPNKYITKVPELYGLKPIENNICEGNVIKTVKDIRIGTFKERAILKNKNEKFKEKGKVKSKVKNVNITDEQRKWINEISKYFEKARLDALFSKGEVKKEWKQFGKISGLFFQDVMEDFIKDNPEFLEEDKKIRKYIANLSQKEARNYIRNILKKEL